MGFIWMIVPVIALAVWAGSFGMRYLAVRFGALDLPNVSRKHHDRAMPLWGGVTIGMGLIFAIVGWMMIEPGLSPLFAWRLAGLVSAISILLVGGMLDDRFRLSPWAQWVFPFCAALVVIASGTRIEVISHPAGGVYSFVWQTWSWTWFSHVWSFVWPADIVTFVWLLLLTYTTKLMDGLDGLVVGQTVIGGALIAALALTHAYYQPKIAWFSALVAAAFLGFLPHNWHPAKQFLGEAGSTLAGFLLAVLAIVSGAKLAIALFALALPLLDAVLVVLGRVRRGQSPFRADASHLHLRLLARGWSEKHIVSVYWFSALACGLAALGLQTRGKLVLFAALCLVGVLFWFFAPRRRI